MIKYLIIFFLALSFCQCSKPLDKQPLPILGNTEIIDGDTIYHTIPDFRFINQDSQMVNNASFENKAYVVDFFFISCPTICPKTTQQMLRIHDRFKGDSQFAMMAHSIDPKRDTVAALKRYAKNLDVSSDTWHFVTGDKDEIRDIADDYFSIVIEDSDAPGGFDHSGRFILIDKNRRIRSFCDGTDPEDVDRLIVDIQTLLDEM